MADQSRGRGRSRGRARGADQQGQGGPHQGRPGPLQGRPGPVPAWGPPRGVGGPPPQATWGPPPGQSQPAPLQPQGPWGNRQQALEVLRAPATQPPSMQTGRATVCVRPGSGDGAGADRSHAAQAAGVSEGVDTSHSARGGIRGRRFVAEPTLVTRPPDMKSKSGNTGQIVKLTANYFRLLGKPNWTLFQYRVDFAPEPERTTIKKKLFRSVIKEALPAYIFDGTVLYTSNKLNPEPMELFADNEGEEPVRVTIKLVGDIAHGDYHYIQFFNIILRKCLDHLKLQLVGRNFFDALAKVSLAEWKLELWPGVITSIRQHEREVLLCCEITHKVMRTDTVLQLLQEHINQERNYQPTFNKAIIGLTVLTDYNNKTYRVDDVDWDTTPTSTFVMKDNSKKRYVDYYKEKYRLNIGNLKQPLLISRARARDIRAGMSDTIYLVPELCRLTGLTENQKNNFQLMKGVATHTRIDPTKRMQKLIEFARRVRREPKIVEELRNWDLNLADQLVEVSGRILPPETIIQGPKGSIKYPTDQSADWTRQLRDKPLLVYGKVDTWVVIYPARCAQATQNFCGLVQRSAQAVKWRLPNPKTYEIRDDRNTTYLDALEQVINQYNPSIILCVVTNNKIERYSAIKKKCCVDRAVPTQVVLAKNLDSKGALSIATKLMLQLNCKLGGAPWSVEIPFNNLMVVGFDVTHDTKNKSQSYGAMVASLDKNCTRYFADVSMHKNGEELSNQLSLNVIKACKKHYDINGCYPARIIIYRDGVGDGQINYVIEHEVNQLEQKLKESFYKSQELKLTFCIVSKRINTRFFANGNNPRPGTVVDDIVTLPERTEVRKVWGATPLGRRIIFLEGA